jgi:hypothetical protein
MMPDLTQETHIALLERDVLVLRAELEQMHVEILALQSERDKALKWGIATLGAMVLTLGGFIVSFLKDHLK